MARTMRGSELIISPEGTLYHINMARKDGFPSRFLLVGDPNRVATAAKFFDEGEVLGRTANREYVTVWGKFKGLPVAVMGTGIGTDNCEIALAELHAVHEFEHGSGTWETRDDPLTLIRVGTSASPQKDIKLGTLGISAHAIGLDNTGLFYLHKPAAEYSSDPDSVFYTPGNETARKIWESVTGELPAMILHAIRPYVSTATPQVVSALEEAAKILTASEAIVGFETGITTSASGFFGPQGRQVGRLGNIAIPDLQERIAKVRVALVSGGVLRTTNNEMESSTLLRLAAEILRYPSAAVCSIIANRAEGEFITSEGYTKSIDGALLVGFMAMHMLA